MLVSVWRCIIMESIMSQKKVQIKKTLGQQTEDQLVNYPSPKDNGLVTAQSYERLAPPTFNPR